jgi:6-phosphogluconate dehydrogenase (decarboxylating)
MQMQLGMIGLGRMGANMAMRLIKADHECIVYDSHPEPVQALVKQGAKGSTDLTAFVKSVSKPRAVWLMVPAAAVDPLLATLTPLLESGDIVIDGGNSYYTVATPIIMTTYAARLSLSRQEFITSMSASAEECGAWSAVTAR